MQLENVSTIYVYQDDLPVGCASGVVCGFKRFYPKCCKSCRFQQGTCEIGIRVSRTQALPLTSDILMSLVVVSLLKGDAFGVSIPVWFYTPVTHWGICVFDTQATHLLRGGTQLHIALPDSTGAKRLGRPESVMLKQPHIVQFIAKAVEHMEPSECIYKGTHASLGICPELF